MCDVTCWWLIPFLSVVLLSHSGCCPDSFSLSLSVLRACMCALSRSLALSLSRSLSLSLSRSRIDCCSFALARSLALSVLLSRSFTRSICSSLSLIQTLYLSFSLALSLALSFLLSLALSLALSFLLSRSFTRSLFPSLSRSFTRSLFPSLSLFHSLYLSLSLALSLALSVLLSRSFTHSIFPSLSRSFTRSIFSLSPVSTWSRNFCTTCKFNRIVIRRESVCACLCVRLGCVLRLVMRGWCVCVWSGGTCVCMCFYGCATAAVWWEIWSWLVWGGVAEVGGGCAGWTRDEEQARVRGGTWACGWHGVSIWVRVATVCTMCHVPCVTCRVRCGVPRVHPPPALPRQLWMVRNKVGRPQTLRRHIPGSTTLRCARHVRIVFLCWSTCGNVYMYIYIYIYIYIPLMYKQAKTCMNLVVCHAWTVWTSLE